MYLICSIKFLTNKGFAVHFLLREVKGEATTMWTGETDISFIVRFIV